MASRLRRLAALGVLVAAVSRSATAGADAPTEAQRAAARAAMDQGYEELERGDARAALDSFLAADERMHVATTGLAVALALAELGRLVEARQCAAAVVLVPLASEAPQAFVAAYVRANRLLVDLDERTPLLAVTTREGTPASLQIDQERVLARDASTGVRLDPGVHVVQATLADGRAAHLEVTLVERDRRSLELAFMSPDPVVSNPRREAAPAPEQGIPKAPGGDARRGWEIAGASTAAAGLVFGLTAGYVALSYRNRAAAECSMGRCPPPSFGDIESARTWSTVSTVSLLAGGAGAVTALVAWLFPRALGDTPKRSLRHVTPVVGVSSVGAAVEF